MKHYLSLTFFLCLNLFLNAQTNPLCFPGLNESHTATVGLQPCGITSADFNSDGHRDLAVANELSNSISILFGDGAGHLSSAINYNVGANPKSLVAGDFNNDGHADLAVANYSAASVSILFGSATGTFATPVSYAVGNNPYSIISGNFNGDSSPDLAMISMNNACVLLGTPGGVFGSVSTFSIVVPAITGSANRIISADFNNDGNLDFAFTRTTNNFIFTKAGTGTGSFGATASFSVGSDAADLAAGDFNADGNMDLAVARANSSESEVKIMTGAGNGNFLTGAIFELPNYAQAIICKDLNMDNKPDLAVASGQSNNVSILLGAGSGSFSPASLYASGGFALALCTADFTGDEFLTSA